MSRDGTRRFTALVGAALAVGLALPAAGSASQVALDGATLRVQAYPGEYNAISISAYEGEVTVTDYAYAETVDPACYRAGFFDVVCPLAGVTSLAVDAGDLEDQVANATELPASLDGGDGGDVLIGGTGADRFAGGDGVDVVNYEGRVASLAVTIGSGADDGEAGEGDELLADVEGVVGGDGDDDLSTTVGAGASLFGGLGDDVLTGSTGDDNLNGGAGADTISGGPLAADDVDAHFYTSRTAPLTVTIGDGLANDGAAGEGDDVQASVEAVHGGEGDDVITGSGRDERLVGNGGDDTLTGGAGDDLLDGGAGIDAFAAGDGDDAVKAKDDAAETVACGADADLAEVDAGDLPSDCEANGSPAGDLDGDGFADRLDCAPGDALRPAKDGIDVNCDGLFDLVEQPAPFALESER